MSGGGWPPELGRLLAVPRQLGRVGGGDWQRRENVRGGRPRSNLRDWSGPAALMCELLALRSLPGPSPEPQVARRLNPLAALWNWRMRPHCTSHPYERDYVRAHWLLGAAHRVAGQHDEAERHLHEALERCRRINAVEAEADILIDLARLRVATGASRTRPSGWPRRRW